MNHENNPTPSFSTRMGKAFANLLRVTLIFVVVAGIAAAVYFGTPWLYQKFILPVETNTTRLADVETKQANEVKQVNTLISDLKTRMGELEINLTENSAALAELKGQMEALDKTVASQSETIKRLEALAKGLDDLQKSSVAQSADLATLQQQITITRSIELLSRAYIYLTQNNYGLARDDLRAAYSLLSGLQVENEQALESVLQRLQLAINNLPQYPIVAVDDVEAAWQLLIGNFSPINPTDTILPAPTSSGQTTLPEVQSTAVVNSTPDQTATVAVTPTP